MGERPRMTAAAGLSRGGLPPRHTGFVDFSTEHMTWRIGRRAGRLVGWILSVWTCFVGLSLIGSAILLGPTDGELGWNGWLTFTVGGSFTVGAGVLGFRTLLRTLPTTSAEEAPGRRAAPSPPEKRPTDVA